MSFKKGLPKKYFLWYKLCIIILTLAERAIEKNLINSWTIWILKIPKYNFPWRKNSENTLHSLEHSCTLEVYIKSTHTEKFFNNASDPHPNKTRNCKNTDRAMRLCEPEKLDEDLKHLLEALDIQRDTITSGSSKTTITSSSTHKSWPSKYKNFWKIFVRYHIASFENVNRRNWQT